MRTKGQIFSADAIIGLLVFMLALSIVFYYFSQISQREIAFNEGFELKDSAFSALSMVVETGGVPENWALIDGTGVKSFGIAQRRGVIDHSKLSSLCNFMDIDYNGARKILGLQKFDAMISASDLNGDSIVSCGGVSAGKRSSFKTSRLSLINGRPCLVSLEVSR